MDAEHPTTMTVNLGHNPTSTGSKQDIPQILRRTAGVEFPSPPPRRSLVKLRL